MKPFVLISLLLGSLILHSLAHADGNCPPGYYPIGGQDVQGCAPLPGYDQQSPQARTAPPQWESRWGAIATDDDKGVIGSAANMQEKEQAEQTALNDCKAKGGTECELAKWYSNGCVAMIIGKKNTT